MRTRDLERWLRSYPEKKIVHMNLVKAYDALTDEDERACIDICPGLGIDVPFSRHCEMCAAFPELRGKPVDHPDGGRHRKCPCYAFGREEATKRLKKLLDRIEKKGMVPNAD